MGEAMSLAYDKKWGEIDERVGPSETSVRVPSTA
jgi:hypothetical protein